jgi:hypothetical protein
MRPPPRDARRRLVVAVAVVFLGLVALVSLAPSLYDVVAKGKGPPIVPYEDSGLVYKVRVVDLFTVYADGESRPNPDKLSSAALVALASMALMTWLLLNAVAADPQRRRFYAFATAGLAYLAADELFAIHETVGHNLQFLADLPGVKRPDDVVFLCYVLPLGAFAWAFRDILLGNRRAVQLFAVGACFFVIAALGDLAGVSVDEPAELAAGICLMGGLVLITVDILRQELNLGPPRSGVVREAEAQAQDRPGVLTRAGHSAV